MYLSNGSILEKFAAGTARKKQTNACGYADKPKTRAASNKLGPGAECTRADTAENLGKLDFDGATRRVRLKIGPKRDPLPPHLSIGPSGPIESNVLVNTLYRFADTQIAGDGRYLALSGLLHREPPQLVGWSTGQPIIAPGQDILAGSLANALAMDQTCLYVQGPAESGKTYTGSYAIALHQRHTDGQAR